MDFELVNDETMLEIPGVIIAYIIFFILATINVKNWKKYGNKSDDKYS